MVKYHIYLSLFSLLLVITLADTCGSGKEDTEECDDMNLRDGDGCDHNCKLEPGWVCYDSPVAGTETRCDKCGKIPTVWPWNFPCQDGNLIDGDGCSSTCQIEDGYECTIDQQYGDKCILHPICGNSTITGNETCDDGNTNNGDGCSSTCQIETGFECSGVPSVCGPICGNSKKDSKEACDDGNSDDGDGCSSLCKVETGYTCTGFPSICEEKCGNSIKNKKEECDDGNSDEGDGCSSLCKVETGYTCSGSPSICKRICGNSQRNGREECDDGNSNDGDGCSSNCILETGFNCTGFPTICERICGNSKQDNQEQCDDGNSKDGDGCSSSCIVETDYNCTGFPSSCEKQCGNSQVTGNEQCDDGNLLNGDGCSSNCTTEQGYLCTGSPSVCTLHCGDSKRNAQEQCDDGNLIDGDGCSSNCTVETYYYCRNGTSKQKDICDIATPTLEKCQEFASLFNQTCNGNKYDHIDQMPGISHSCKNVGNCSNPLSASGECTWERKLCAYCYMKNSLTMIKVQANLLPDHCFYSYKKAPKDEQYYLDVAFSLKPKVLQTRNYSTQEQVDFEQCQKFTEQTDDFKKDPIYQFFEYYRDQPVGIGITINGVKINNPISYFAMDPFYPKNYTDNFMMQNFPDQYLPVYPLDYCLGHLRYWDQYHYNSFSPCIFSQTLKNQAMGDKCQNFQDCGVNPLAYSLKNAPASLKAIIPVGIAIDGHIILGPYKDSQNLWQPCDVDICNGVIYNGDYVYVMTMFHPYTVGCWGPANNKTIGAVCTTNAKLCTSQATINNTINVAFLILCYMLLIIQ